MNYNYCPLYGLKSKKRLKYLLKIKNSKMLSQAHIAKHVEPYIDIQGRPRLIEPPSVELKAIQKRIKNLLSKIIVPDNVFSGIKGRSYVDNARMHSNGLRYLFKVDLTAFFPSITRETVYTFFREDLHCSSDVAEALTNLTTIDIQKSKAKNINEIYCFLDAKQVNVINHLISGAPTSQILSYLVNHKMFDELQLLSDKNKITMSVYVDDITFSSEFRISHMFREKVYQIIKKYNYKISKKKVKGYSKLYPKLITGVIIDANGNLVIKNTLRRKIILEFRKLMEDPADDESRQRLRGLATAARQINKAAYPFIYKFAFDNKQ
ncbi:MAG: Reverse transcriptase (RNA-dependent DNA polymerase) [Firmicutes bacterium ADurb.Bin300]|nr:MAG: Reverse transcriptase (RNA-dependent DNA polymerase) [Firmicutes bacterium ADurb.Bin300]